MGMNRKSEKPPIAILMAVYEPQMEWLKEQLCSLNEQTYPNLCLYLRDDCSRQSVFQQIQDVLKTSITAFPYILRRNAVNMGSNRTFERLTQEAEGEYFAYCDQDDVWFPDKLSQYEEVLRERKNALLVCSDMCIIDQNGTIIAESITKIRRHHHFQEGKGLAKELLFSNFVTGCAMMLRSESAKAAIPFCPYMVHDHYLAFFCARIGEIALIRRPLIFYRIHENNQTQDMAGVKDKESYFQFRIMQIAERLRWLRERFGEEQGLRLPLEQGECWADARRNYFRTGLDGKTIWKYRRFGEKTALFELAARLLPNWMFMACINLKRHNLI